MALALDGEVVSADSMQIYKGMDIGTGKVLPNEQKVRHWGLNLVDPGSAYSAALYQAYARACMQDIDTRGKRVVLCGGTGLYIRAAIDDYRFVPGGQIDNPVREKYQEMAEKEGSGRVWQELDKRDPESAKIIHPHNIRRLIRALEMLEENTSYAEQKQALSNLRQIIPASLYGLRVEKEVLHERISTRVDQMFENGLVEEVKDLLNKGFREGVTAPQAIGYKEVVAYLEGQIGLDGAMEAIKLATRRYAKKQRTWFRKDTRIKWIQADDQNEDRMLNEIMEGILQEKDETRLL